MRRSPGYDSHISSQISEIERADEGQIRLQSALLRAGTRVRITHLDRIYIADIFEINNHLALPNFGIR